MPKDSEQRKFALALSVSAIISSNVVGGVLIGYYLDRWLKTGPWMILIGIILGTIGAFAGLYRLMSRLNEK